ncbi:MAG: monovalent cation/H(+) antiporter subunit G [Vicinamibacteraceae bacterium]
MAEAMRVAADVLVLLALGMMTLAVVGLVRMPDIYNRVHAAGQALWLSVVPLLVAQLTLGDGAIAAKTLLLSAFFLLTTPVAAHAIARAAFRRDREPEETPETRR